MVRALLEELIPDDFHLNVNGRYHVAVGSWPTMRLRYISSFRSKAEVIDAVLCSMAIPGFVAAPLYSPHSGWRGFYVDGGYVSFCVTVFLRCVARCLSTARDGCVLPFLLLPSASCFVSDLLHQRNRG